MRGSLHYIPELVNANSVGARCALGPWTSVTFRSNFLPTVPAQLGPPSYDTRSDEPTNGHLTHPVSHDSDDATNQAIISLNFHFETTAHIWAFPNDLDSLPVCPPRTALAFWPSLACL